ncbi:MAG: hypothetical protein VB877_00815 [Pirellulaceae bacterium]
MYVGNSRTLKTILEQLSDADTFAAQRDELLATQQHRSFRFVLRFQGAENSYGYATDHPLHNGYTVSGQLPDSRQQIRISLQSQANSFVETLRAGDTMEVVAALNRWDPAYDVVEMEHTPDSQLDNSPVAKGTRDLSVDNRLENSKPAILDPTIRSRYQAVGETQVVPTPSHPRRESRNGIRKLLSVVMIVAFVGCAVTTTLFFASSPTAIGWSETRAKLVYYKQKRYDKFITYHYTVNKKEYTKTIPYEAQLGPAGNFLWVTYQDDSPETATVSHRRNYMNSITMIAVLPFLLVFFVSARIVIAQVTQSPRSR